MTAPILAPHGAWRSPITSALITESSVGLGQVVLAGAGVCWGEARPKESGRTTVVHRTADGTITDVIPAPFNARTRVHEYGGGAFAVVGDMLFFANFADQRLHRMSLSARDAPQPLTPACDSALRYADFAADPSRRRLLCVREDHRDAAHGVVNAIAAVAMDGDDAGGRVLVAGNDFYAAPRLDPTGTRLAWLTWNHPDMPWDGCELWVADVTPAGDLASVRRVAGGRDEALFQPAWSPAGVLHVVSDRSGWWNLFRVDEARGELVPLAPRAAEFGVPQWIFGSATYGFASAARIVCAYREAGHWKLATIDGIAEAAPRLAPLPTPYSEIAEVRVDANRVVFVGGAPDLPRAVVQLDLARGAAAVLRQSRTVEIPDGYFSIPQPIEFSTTGGLTAHGFYYAPVNRDFAGPAGTLPPLFVQSHGGPTGTADSTLNLGVQYWTSRGFAVLDVDYGGSAGYGRAYRRRLDGQWGVVDVDDCVNGARALVDRGLVDGARLVIRGWSASGYTTLAALTFRDVFRAGESHFGVSDVEALALKTHKFESRYLDRLIGPYPARRDLYIARSPIHFTDRLACPLILFQGLEDKAVPPAQASLMFDAVKAKGIPVAYVPFEGEQHGFRRAENIRRAIDGALYFYSRVLGFALPDAAEPVAIANL